MRVTPLYGCFAGVQLFHWRLDRKAVALSALVHMLVFLPLLFAKLYALHLLSLTATYLALRRTAPTVNSALLGFRGST